METTDKQKVLDLARDFKSQGVQCVVGRRGVCFGQLAELVRFAVLLERAGVNVLDMGRPTTGQGTLTSVASGGIAGTNYVLPFEAD